MTFKIQLERKCHLQKPQGTQIAVIQNSLHTCEMTVDKLSWAMRVGMTAKPAITDGQKFLSQQVFIVDVDNAATVRSVQENKIICQKIGIYPNIIVKTFSGTAENQRHHLVFVTEAPIQNAVLRNELQTALTSVFAGDKSCNDVSRIFFGGDFIYFKQTMHFLTETHITKLIGRDLRCTLQRP